jgi:hypothetical protein
MDEQDNYRQEELVPSVEEVTDLRPLLEDLAEVKSIIRVFENGKFPLVEDRKIKVYAEIHHDSFSSIRRPLIPKSRKERGSSLTFVYIAPASPNHDLTYYWHVHNLQGAESPIISFGFEEDKGNLTISEDVHYDFYTRQKNIHKSVQKDFNEKGKIFLLDDFGWGDY